MSTRETDFANSYDLIISAIRKGSTTLPHDDGTTSSIEDKLRSIVKFGSQFLGYAEQELNRKYNAPDEQATLEAWLTVLQATQTLPSGDRKKLLKQLDKDFRWPHWNLKHTN